MSWRNWLSANLSHIWQLIRAENLMGLKVPLPHYLLGFHPGVWDEPSERTGQNGVNFRYFVLDMAPNIWTIKSLTTITIYYNKLSISRMHLIDVNGSKWCETRTLYGPLFSPRGRVEENDQSQQKSPQVTHRQTALRLDLHHFFSWTPWFYHQKTNDVWELQNAILTIPTWNYLDLCDEL